LLLTIDTLRSDHTSTYGYGLETTPRLSELAEEGVLFETVYAPVGATCPSHASLFTSKYPISHGVVRNGLELVEEEYTLGERMQDAGYATGGFVSSFPVTRRFGFGQGFDHFDETFEAKSSKLATETWTKVEVEDGFDRSGSVTTAAATAWLDGIESTTPVFLWVHLFDPHYPYRKRPRFRQRFPDKPADTPQDLVMVYDSEVAFADEKIGELVEHFRARASGRGELIVFTADHGEGLDDHGITGHNATVYEEEVRIPLVLVWDGHLPAGVRLEQPAHLVDIGPTIVGLLGLETIANSEGLDLAPYCLGATESNTQRPVFFQRPTYPRERKRFTQSGPAYGVRIGRWKYTEPTGDEPRELFDLSADPRERENLVEVETERAAELAAVLADWLAVQRAGAPDRDLQEHAQNEAGLRALGYMDEEPAEEDE
jgi:choline-sulfatase